MYQPRVTDTGYPYTPVQQHLPANEPLQIILGHQHFCSGQVTQNNTPEWNPGMSTFAVDQDCAPRQTRILHVDRNVLPSDAQFHTYPSVDTHACSWKQRVWNGLASAQKNKNAATTKYAAADKHIFHINSPRDAAAERLLLEMETQPEMLLLLT